MTKRLSTYDIVLSVIILVALVLLFVQNVDAITGHATEGSTTSQVVISKYLSIQMSNNLTAGIDFGTINTLGVSNYNATGNYNVSDVSEYYIEVSTDSNTWVDFCTRADGDMTTVGGDAIGLGNESYDTEVNSSNASVPSVSEEVSFTTSYVGAASDVPIGNRSYWRFWLDAPVGQSVGTYNNTIYFEGVAQGQGC